MNGGLFWLRPGRPSDHAYVVETWLQSDKHSSAGRGEGEGYMRRHKARIRALLARADLRIAHDPEDDDAILGWACLEHVRSAWHVHYVYVRDGVRRQGAAKALLMDVRATGEPVICGALPVVRDSKTPDRRLGLPKAWRYDRSVVYSEAAPKEQPQGEP